MRRLLLVLLLLMIVNGIKSQTLNPYYQTIVSDVNYDTVLYHLQSFENFGEKSPSSLALVNTSDWLVAKYQSFGYTDIVRDTFTYQGNTMFNIITTKTGTLYPNTFLIICGHYDTKNGPGTNDNGSGVSVILEIARLLQPVATKYSVRFINFSGEEEGFIGSSHYVDDFVVPLNMDILLVFNIDEVGGIAGITNNTITCEYDNGLPWGNNSISQDYTDTLENLTGLYSNLAVVQNFAYGSDYMPFEDNSEIITGYYETNESSFVHSSSDLLSNLDTSYVTEIAKAATGAALYFAKAYDISVNIEHPVNIFSDIYPVPFYDRLYITGNTGEKVNFNLRDDLGREIIFLFGNIIPFTLDLSAIRPGVYFYSIIHDQGNKIESGKLIKSKKP
jgi:hypothetical protein